MSKDVKRAITIIVIFALYFIITSLPTPAGLTPAGQKMIALMLCIVVTWVTEVIPIIISSMVFMFLVFVIGVTTPEAQVTKDFASPTVFFVFASVLFAYALDRCGLNNRLALKLTVLSKGQPKRLLLYMMFGTAFLSTIVSNIPACASFFFLAIALIKKNKLVKGTSNYSKALILGVILAAMAGGNATPAGSSLNVLGLSLLSQATDGASTLNFLQWSTLGIPFTIVIIPLLWLVVCLVFPPEIKSLTGIEETKKDLMELGPLKADEWKFIIVTALLVFVWFTEDILHPLPLSTSTVLICSLYFFPGIGLLTYDYVKEKLDWTLIIMIGASGTFGAGMTKTGAALWMANGILGPFADSGLFTLIIVVVIFTTLIHIIVPSNPAIVGILVPTLAAFALNADINPMALYLPMAFTVAASWFFPFDPVPLITWSERYFTMFDFFKVGVIGHVVVAVLVVVLMFGLAMPLGYF